MTHWTRGGWTVLGSSAVTTGALLVSTADAVAHKGHPHREEAEAAAPTTDEQTVSNTEAASDPSTTTQTEAVIAPANDVPIKTDKSPIEQAASEALTAPAAISQARITEGFSIGLGESLLGLIITGPFLLLTLKKQLQS